MTAVLASIAGPDVAAEPMGLPKSRVAALATRQWYADRVRTKYAEFQRVQKELQAMRDQLAVVDQMCKEGWSDDEALPA
jgi:hypothetical protein